MSGRFGERQLAAFLLALSAVATVKVTVAEGHTLRHVDFSGPAALPAFILITRGYFGGEARFEGSLRVENGWIVAVSDTRQTTSLFDAGAKMGMDRRSLSGVGREAVPLRQRFTSGAATLRQNGRGWSIVDIERFYNVNIPAACPSRDVVRVHNLATIRETTR